jgi:hypothetical protein
LIARKSALNLRDCILGTPDRDSEARAATSRPLFLLE